MSLKTESSKLYLSFLWWIIEPLLFVLSFYFVFNVLLKYGDENYLIFLMCAKVPYMWFSKAVTTASGSIVANRGIISQIDISKAIFPYASVQISLYKETPVFLLLTGLCLIYGYKPTADWLLLFPLLVGLYLMIVFFSLLTAILVCYADDVRMIINMIMLLLMFVSGIFFDMSIVDENLREYMFTYNPVAFFCDGFRVILMNKGIYDIDHLIKLSVAFIFLIIGMHYIYRTMNRSIASKVVNS